MGTFAILGDTFPFLWDFLRGRGAPTVGLQMSEDREESLKVRSRGHSGAERGVRTFMGPNGRSGDHDVKL